LAPLIGLKKRKKFYKCKYFASSGPAGQVGLGLHRSINSLKYFCPWSNGWTRSKGVRQASGQVRARRGRLKGREYNRVLSFKG